jgi:EAL domain-containing protein (putative c-di-GMP-specific phosphodiesterase class I)
MYCAKETGRNMFLFFSDTMKVRAAERLEIENGLRTAIQADEMFLVYQPVVNLRSGEIGELEALLRWRHPELGLVDPQKFIAVAESCGLIVPIGEWVLKSACRSARKWQLDGVGNFTVAVNVSAVQLQQPAFCEFVREVLAATGLEPRFLELELTETQLLSNAEVMLPLLRSLTNMGVKLALDDFGTGYSSLTYLRHFPLNKVKIDRSFVHTVNLSSDDAAIIKAVISMAKELKLRVVAEGVEKLEQLSFLRAHGCDEGQGFLFSKPLAREDIGVGMQQRLRAILSSESGTLIPAPSSSRIAEIEEFKTVD